MDDFFSYYEQVGSRPNNMVTEAVRRFVKRRGAALDLGCGNFRDSRWLKLHGFARVVAVDPGEVEGFLHDGIEYRKEYVEDFTIEVGGYDFVAACSVFHYLHVDDTAALIPRIMSGLRPGGVFTFNVLGERDSWAMSSDRAFFTSNALDRLVSPYRLLEAISERELTLKKKWHMYYCVLCNR